MTTEKQTAIEIPQDIKDFVASMTADGTLDEKDVEAIAHYATSRQAERPLYEDQLSAIADYAMACAGESFSKAVPLPLKIIGAIVGIDGLTTIFPTITTFNSLLDLIGKGHFDGMAATSVVLMVLAVILYLAYAVLSVFLGVRLLRDKRSNAARIVRAMAAVLVVAIVIAAMLEGIGTAMAFLVVAFVVLVVLESYLNVSLRNETDLRYRLLMIDTEQRAKSGTLGLELRPGRGFAKMDFVNLFWIFVIGCVVGIIVETIFTMTVTHPGVYENRTGLLFGQFSPIYGIGGALMTIALNRYQDRNIILVFVVCTIIGGGFEYFVSWFMEVGFGAKAWDYSDQFLGNLFGGRTCLLFASMFGVLGTFHIKVLLPQLIKLINLIPWKIRYSVTGVCAAFMLVNCLMTVQALDCWYGRVSGKVPQTPVEQFYADHFGNDVMQNIFQTMTITPENSARAHQ